MLSSANNNWPLDLITLLVVTYDLFGCRLLFVFFFLFCISFPSRFFALFWSFANQTSLLLLFLCPIYYCHFLAHSSVFFLSCFLAQRDQCDNDNNHNKFKENWKLFAYDDNPNHLRVHPGRATVMHELLHKFQDRVGYDPSGPRDRTRFEQMKRDPGEYNFLDNSIKMQYIVCSFYSVYCTCKNV